MIQHFSRLQIQIHHCSQLIVTFKETIKQVAQAGKETSAPVRLFPGVRVISKNALLNIGIAQDIAKKKAKHLTTSP